MNKIQIDRFEIAIAPDGDVLICFMGRASIPNNTVVKIENDNLIIDRSPAPAVCLTGIVQQDLDAIKVAKNIFIDRFFEEDHTTTQATYCA